MKREENYQDNSFGIASVILGIVGSVLGVLVLPVLLSIIGLVFGIVQYKKGKNAWAIWGIALSVLGIIIAIYLAVQVATAYSQAQQLMAACQADPSAPGCEDLLNFARIQSS